MTDTLKAVVEFHEAFEIQIGKRPATIGLGGGDQQASLNNAVRMMEDLAQLLLYNSKQHKCPIMLRLQLCQEELAELGRAMLDSDLVECLDALVDMRYVADGATVALGLHHIFDEAFDEVHRSNMSKLVDGKPVKNEAGRVLKPESYSPPELVPILVDGGW